MKVKIQFSRRAALFLILALSSPSPTFAMRGENSLEANSALAIQAGLEEGTVRSRFVKGAAIGVMAAAVTAAGYLGYQKLTAPAPQQAAPQAHVAPQIPEVPQQAPQAKVPGPSQRWIPPETADFKVDDTQPFGLGMVPDLDRPIPAPVVPAQRGAKKGGLEENRVQHYAGMALYGDPTQVVTSSEIGSNLNLELGRRETFVVDLAGLEEAESAKLPSDLLILRQPGAEVPAVLAGVPQVPLSTGLEEARATFEQLAAQGKKRVVALMSPDTAQTDEWDRLLRSYEVIGIRMTPNTVAILARMGEKNIAFLISVMQNQRPGLILETGLEENAAGRRLFLDA